MGCWTIACLAGGVAVGWDLAGGGGPVVGAPGSVMRVPLGKLGIAGFFTFVMLMASGGIDGAGAVSGSPSTMIMSLSLPVAVDPVFSSTWFRESALILLKVFNFKPGRL